MAGLGLMIRRRALASSPTSMRMEDSLIAQYSFEGRSNSDADKNIVHDKSGNGKPMEVQMNDWGGGDAYTKNGYFNDLLCHFPTQDSDASNIKIPLTRPLTRHGFTIILERQRFNIAGQTQYACQLGSEAVGNTNKSPILIEYVDASLANSEEIKTTAFGSTAFSGQSDNNVIWLTTESYCGIQSQEYAPINDYIVNTLYVGRVRSGMYATQRFSIKSIHVFDATFSKKQVESYIRKVIDPTYSIEV